MSSRHFSSTSLRLSVLKTVNCRKQLRNFRHHRHCGRGYVGGQSTAIAIATSSSSPTERLALQLVAGSTIQLESRRVAITGITPHPNDPWIEQIARNVTMDARDILDGCRYLLHDRDRKYSVAFQAIIESAHVETLPLPARSPNLNAYAERWVRSS
jgi:hypothetical protein